MSGSSETPSLPLHERQAIVAHLRARPLLYLRFAVLTVLFWAIDKVWPYKVSINLHFRDEP